MNDLDGKNNKLIGGFVSSLLMLLMLQLLFSCETTREYVIRKKITKVFSDNLYYYCLCYKDELDHSSKPVEGTFNLDIIILRTGKVKSIKHYTHVDFSNKMVSCIDKVTERIEFPASAKNYGVNQPINFHVKDKDKYKKESPEEYCSRKHRHGRTYAGY